MKEKWYTVQNPARIIMRNVNKKHTESLTVTEKIAIVISNKVGTFSCFVFFAVLALISLPSVIFSHSLIIFVSWITQSFIQLVLLPLIMISQNLSQRHSDIRADEDFNVNLKAEKEVEELHKKLDKIIKKLK